MINDQNSVRTRLGNLIRMGRVWVFLGLIVFLFLPSFWGVGTQHGKEATNSKSRRREHHRESINTERGGMDDGTGTRKI